MRAAFHTLGCKTNAYETQAMIEQFEGAGFEIVPFSSVADLYVINTCSVTAEAARKSRQMLRRAKSMNPDALVCACGCFAQEVKEELLKGAAVDFVVGNNEKSRLIDLVLSEKTKEQVPVVIDDLMHCSEYEEQMITNAGSHVRAYVKIQDGCNRFCSYCIIPYLRGRSRSRSEAEILSEARKLSEKGIREIVLTGIDISDFRKEAGEEDPFALSDLIFSLEEIEGIERIRLGSLEAGIVSPDFVRRIGESKKLCPHFHLSLQSGCDATLKRMNRHYTTKEFSDCVTLLREAFPSPSITTDVIAGFPEESEEEFEETLQFVKEIAFSQMHVFPYSRRKGTKADRMPGQLSRAEKAKRAQRLIEAGKQMQRAYMEQFLGTPVPVLLEEKVVFEGNEYFVGFTPRYIRALVPADAGEINKIVTICPNRIAESGAESVLV